tara:strand:- start:1314 stop:2033 length:720 start_codon:yes stop_codon:yes gene_type:complete
MVTSLARSQIARAAFSLKRHLSRQQMGGRRVYDRKLFCVGMNKTGTTSIHRLMRQWHYDVAPQWEGERLFDEAGLHASDMLFAWIKRHEAFQDVPFSCTDLVPELVTRYPDARFILTRRDPEEWFESLRNHHFTLLGLQQDATTNQIASALKICPYIAPGYLGRLVRKLFNIYSDDLLYDRDHHIAQILSHDTAVRAAVPENQLLEVSLIDLQDTSEICSFLGLSNSAVSAVPHVNQRR